MCSKHWSSKYLETARGVSIGLLVCRQAVLLVIFGECFEIWIGLQLT